MLNIESTSGRKDDLKRKWTDTRHDGLLHHGESIGHVIQTKEHGPWVYHHNSMGSNSEGPVYSKEFKHRTKAVEAL